MTLKDLLKDLQRFAEEHPDSRGAEVFTVHGASGNMDPIGSFSVQTCNTSNVYGEFLEDEGLEDGEEYVQLYIGN